MWEEAARCREKTVSLKSEKWQCFDASSHQAYDPGQGISLSVLVSSMKNRDTIHICPFKPCCVVQRLNTVGIKTFVCNYFH